MRTRFFEAAALLVAIAACDDAPQRVDDRLEVVDGVLLVYGAAGEVALRLRPAVRVDGAWRDDAFVRVFDGAAVVGFEPTEDTVVEALALAGSGPAGGATAWISNGFQSWSNSGALALPAIDGPFDAIPAEVTTTGDAETLRQGRMSWFYTAVGGGERAFVVGALTAARLRPWVQVGLAGDTLHVRAVSGGGGERVPVAAGDLLGSERWHFAVGPAPIPLLEAYGDALPSRRREHPRAAPAGWNSWYELFDAVDEAAVRANAAVVHAVLDPVRPAGAPRLRIVIDDGWQQRWGEWTPNDKFPSGLDGLAADLKADGFEVGVWLAPLLVSERSALVADHPDWFVADAVFHHLGNGRMRILDVTHPEAAAHLGEVIRRLVGWGYDFLKIDFLFAGTFEGGRHRPMTGLAAYQRALAIIREAAGEHTELVAVGAPPHPSFPFVDAWRVGPDIAFGAIGAAYPALPHQARSLSARWPLCRATLCDADPVLQRELTREEVEIGGWIVALAGGALFVSDDLRVLPEERRGWGLDAARAALASGGAPAVPEPPWPAELPESLTSPLTDLLRDEVSAGVPARWRLPGGGAVTFDFVSKAVTRE